MSGTIAMNSQTAQSASDQKEPVLITIALAPLRAIERTRGWRRIGLLVLYGLIALAIWAQLRRRAQLAGLPDIGEPFDVAAFRARGRVADDRNAFVLYRQAVDRFRDMNKAESASFEKANLTWSNSDQLFRDWVREHDEAISLLCAGAARPECGLDSPGDMTDTAAIQANSTLAPRLSWIATAALFKAEKLQSDGDATGAWNLLKSVVRASRHVEWAGQGRSIGIMMIQYAREPIRVWAKDRSVTVAMLRQALDDLAAAEALTPPISTFYKTEYLVALDSLANPAPLIAARAKQRPDRGAWHPFTIAPALEAYLDGEPERSRRVLNLLLANDLAWCDRPVADQPPIAVDRLHLFEPDPTAPAAARALAPEDLAKAADACLIVPTVPWRMGEIEQLERIDRWSMNVLFESIAVPLFFEETGHPPASPAEAVKRYRPGPGDTPDRDEAKPLP
jgi:hypothetical protein